MNMTTVAQGRHSLRDDPRDAQQIFEYACHEGNLGLEHILAAARAAEKR